jgi:hypothetical protein
MFSEELEKYQKQHAKSQMILEIVHRRLGQHREDLKNAAGDLEKEGEIREAIDYCIEFCREWEEMSAKAIKGIRAMTELIQIASGL